VAGRLVTLTVGETGRSGGPRGRGRQGGGEGPAPAKQWGCRWTAEGPGPVSEGPEAEPDLSLALSPADALLVAEGKLAPSVAFMQGRLKTSGDNALLLKILAWSATPGFDEALREWRRSKPAAPA
jgi:hypothetical protein